MAWAVRPTLGDDRVRGLTDHAAMQARAPHGGGRMRVHACAHARSEQPAGHATLSLKQGHHEFVDAPAHTAAARAAVHRHRGGSHHIQQAPQRQAPLPHASWQGAWRARVLSGGYVARMHAPQIRGAHATPAPARSGFNPGAKRPGTSACMGAGARVSRDTGLGVGVGGGRNHHSPLHGARLAAGRPCRAGSVGRLPAARRRNLPEAGHHPALPRGMAPAHEARAPRGEAGAPRGGGGGCWRVPSADLAPRQVAHHVVRGSTCCSQAQ